MTRSRLLAMVATAVALLSFAACGRDGGDGVSSETNSTTTSTTTATTDDVTTTSAAAGSAPGTTGGSPATTSGSTATTSSGAGSGTPDDPEADGVIEVNIVGGVVEGGVQRRPIKQGSQVTLRFTSDAADEIHVHAYDLRQELTPGQSADLTFLAKIPGVIDVEIENRKRKVLELEVKP